MLSNPASFTLAQIWYAQLTIKDVYDTSTSRESFYGSAFNKFQKKYNNKM